MLFSELEHILSGKLTLHQDEEINRFSADTRSLTGSSNEVFVALRGKRDGHSFIDEAIRNGVKNFIVEEAVQHEKANIFEVKSSIEAFHQIAKNHRDKFLLPIIGITGSNGKTTVKEWLATLLSEQFFVIKNPKSYNSQIGVPLSVLEIQETHELGIFEAGISQRDEMWRLEQIIQPTIGLFTTLGSAHSEGFGSMEEKLQEKLTLFKSCEKVIYRADAPYASTISKEIGKNSITWSLDQSADYRVSWEEGVIQVDGVGYKTKITSPTDLENATHAIIAALAMGLSQQSIQKGLDMIRPIPMRLELKKGINGCFLLDDTYNNDLQGLKVAIDYFDSHQQHAKKTLILSDILQSGKSDSDLYAEVNQLLMKRKIDRLIGVGPRISNAEKAFSLESSFYDSVGDLLLHLPSFEREMIILKGARDYALERVVKRLEQRTHGTVLEVNFEALQHNLNQYRNLLDPGTKMMVMVKANAYGSGILEIANFLQHQRVDRLGVAYIDEAIRLRKHGIHLPIMIMNPDIDSFHDFKRYKLEAEIFSLSHFEHFLASADSSTPIHLKIDTGMHRLGFGEDDIPALLQILKDHPTIHVEGIFTHFAGSESELHDEFTRKQAGQFNDAYRRLTEALQYAPTKHACNSSGIVRWPQHHYDMVRLGIGLHGFDPTGQLNLRSTSQLNPFPN